MLRLPVSCYSPALIPNARTGNRAQLQANNFSNLEVKKDKKKSQKKTSQDKKSKGKNKYAEQFCCSKIFPRFIWNSTNIGIFKGTKNIHIYSMYPTEGTCMKLDVFRNS